LPLPTPPASLVAEILAGNCIAFVGAGFSAAAQLPQWGALLEGVARAEQVSESIAEHVGNRVKNGSAHALDEAAQSLEDAIGREQLVAALDQQLGHPTPTDAIEQRLHCLRGIPFGSVLTTNFDAVLQGALPGHDAYRQVLRPRNWGWWEQRYWTGNEGAFTLKLHGDVTAREAGAAEIVLTRRDYRRRLYDDAAYTTFLRSVMATRTVLYLGFSFEDAYLNELRSEILALLGQEPNSAPLAYAVINDVPATTRKHFRRHEGIEILNYDTHQQTDFDGFDRWLEALHRATNPLVRFGQHLKHHRILWIDPHPENNETAFRALRSASELAGQTGYALVTVATADEGVRKLEAAAAQDQTFDLVITHWGEGQAQDESGASIPTAVRLLSQIRARDFRTPAIVFAAPDETGRRKRTALSYGAVAYCFAFAALFREIEAVFCSDSP
jgi:CheY-like chemotaxis protein